MQTYLKDDAIMPKQELKEAKKNPKNQSKCFYKTIFAKCRTAALKARSQKVSNHDLCNKAKITFSALTQSSLANSWQALL